MAVYNVSTSPGITDLGKTVLPADIKPFDFSALDNALKAESDISTKALDIMMENVKDIGTVRDQLTSIQTPSAYHKEQIDAAKKANGLDETAIKQAVNNIENSLATYDIHRKMNKLAYDPRIKDAMHDSAVLENYKANLPKITDPNLRALAIGDLAGITENMDPNAIKNLNLDQYKSVDLEPAYIEALDNFAPYVTTDEQKYGPNGQYTLRTTKRDTAMIAKTREYFSKNPLVKNNLIANGYWDKETDKPVGTWFDDLEKSQSVEQSQILNVKGAPGQSKNAGDGYTYTPTTDLSSVKYNSDTYDDKDNETSYELGIISGVETGGRAANNVVHKDSNNAINLGAFSFNGGVGTAQEFLKYLDDVVITPDAITALAELKKIPLSGGDLDANVVKAKAAYKKLEDAMNGQLPLLEKQFAVEKFGNPIIEHIRTKEDLANLPISRGLSTFLMDASIHHGEPAVEKWINDYAKLSSDERPDLLQYIAQRRMKLIAGLTKYDKETRDSLIDRVIKVADAVMSLDGGGNTTEETARGPVAAQPQQPGATSSAIDLSRLNIGMDPAVSTAVDSINNAQTNDAVNFWLTSPQQ